MVCLNFWASWNVPSIEEFRALDTLRKRFGKQLEIINISTDRKVDGVKSVLSAYHIKYGSLHYANYKDILDDYNIVGIPTFVLIDEQGKIINANARHPSDGLLEYIDNIFAARELEKRKQSDAKKRDRDKKRIDEINNNRKNKKK